MNVKVKKSQIMRLSLVALLMVFFGISSYSQIEGNWKTVDDDTGETVSIVKIWKANDGLYYGKVTNLFKEADKNSVCSACPKSDPRYNKKVQGMTVISKMKKTDDNEWEGGKILDPANGKEYTCKIWRDGKKLKVRGYIGWLFRTQTWLPAN